MKAKKSLGQNFLKSEQALRKIIEAGEISGSDTIVEIGPGKGALTQKLLENAGKVIAVEKDSELYEYLQIKFEKQIKSKDLILVKGDVLDFDPDT
jgi:16S rRNA (adenine1518-N6/adenine1519-N6)-dimethyltransferase